MGTWSEFEAEVGRIRRARRRDERRRMMFGSMAQNLKLAIRGLVDMGTYAAVALGMSGVAALAAWIPALRATRVDPQQALKAE